MARRAQPGQVTLYDVARAAGVSRATAARVLGGYGRASAEARDRVRAAAAELRYRPNAPARSIRSGRTGTLGVVVADIGLAFFAQAVRGIADAAHHEGFEVILANTDEEIAAERAAVGVLLDKRVDGMIVAPSEPSDVGHLLEAQERGIPIVLFDRGAPALPCDVVVVDNTAAARNAVHHLVRLGHRRVAIVIEKRSSIAASDLATVHLGPASGMTSTLRQIGWWQALTEAGLPGDNDLILGAQYDRADACRVTAAALARPDRPTAVVTTDETMTLGALDAIGELGLDIPGDVSLVGFDDLPWTSLVRPALSVVAQPLPEIGATAARRLLRRIGGFDGPPETVMLRMTFVVRGSTGPARPSIEPKDGKDRA
jgi:LacI family transcriptional regulator